MTAASPPGHRYDLHCHILPWLDDGAADLDDSLAMARQAAADGIGTICATPHIHVDHDVVIGEIEARVAVLNATLEAAGIPVTVVTGGELSAPLADRLTDAELRAVSLGGGGHWILVEPAPGPMDDALEAVVDHLHRRGVRCVIAHPERHAGADAAGRLRALVERGCLVQVTSAFLVGHGAAPVMLEWAEAGLVHLVSSDAHSARIGRPATVSTGLGALAVVPRIEAHMDWIAHEAPRAVLAGEPVLPPF